MDGRFSFVRLCFVLFGLFVLVLMFLFWGVVTHCTTARPRHIATDVQVNEINDKPLR